MRWIEIIMGFECNCRCRVCPSVTQIGTLPMTLKEIEHWLRLAQRRGARNVWFGGGEPTLHPDLIPALSQAARLGYRRIKIQTNGMRFAYRPYALRCLTSGATEFSVSVKGADSQTHDVIARNDRCFELLCRGIENLSAEGARIQADVLMTTSNIDQLDRIVSVFGKLGVTEFSFWLMSLHGLENRDTARLMPRMTEANRYLALAFQEADQLGLGASTWHTPPCTLPAEYRNRYVPSSTLELTVVTPGSEPFKAEDSPMEGGAYLESCGGCTARPGCLGPRRDYLDRYGAEEFRPIRK